MRWMKPVTSLFFTFLVAPALASQDLYTGHSLTGGSTEETICIITNVNSKPIEVTAEILDSSNSSLVPGQLKGCPVPPATLAPWSLMLDRLVQLQHGRDRLLPLHDLQQQGPS